jgi:hypothetical protein
MLPAALALCGTLLCLTPLGQPAILGVLLGIAMAAAWLAWRRPADTEPV